MIKTRAPGKLILSGEHAVTQGAPALAFAVNRFVDTTITPADDFQFNFVAFDDHATCTLLELQNLRTTIDARYTQFQAGKMTINAVLQHPRQLIQYAAARLVEQLELGIMGLAITIQSSIPVASGLGSSAASIVSLYGALKYWRDGCLGETDIVTLKAIESLQHGYSSGVDLLVSAEGGCHYFQDLQSSRRVLPLFPLYCINTGGRSDLSGLSITKIANLWQDNSLLSEFYAVTQAMDIALKQGDFTAFCRAIRHNHQLLIKIGVVPSKVAALIASLERHGFAAKVSGAGAVAGDQAGVVLLSGEGDPMTICHEYGYEIMEITGDEQGVRVL